MHWHTGFSRVASLALTSVLVGCGDAAEGTLPSLDGALAEVSMADRASADRGSDAFTVPRDGAADARPPARDVPVAPRDGPLVTNDSGVLPPQDVAMDSPGVDVPEAPRDVPMAPIATALLEIHPLDLWAQPLPASGFTLSVRRDGSDVSTETVAGSASVQRVALVGAASYELSLAAPEHRTLRVTVVFDGTSSPMGAVLRAGVDATGHGLSIAHATGALEGRTLPVHSVFLGLRHLWFSAQGRPARRGNTLRLLMDGEEAFNQVDSVLRAARSSVNIATWWWESDFELRRDPATHATLSPDARRRNTILGVLEAIPARKRVMVGQFLGMDGVASTLSSDAALRAHGTLAGDEFEYMGQANPSSGMLDFRVPPFRFGDRVRAEVSSARGATFDTERDIASEVPGHIADLTHWPVAIDLLHASYHQKFLVIDDRVSFIGGMNFRRVDWDTSQHLVFEPRRMLFDSSLARRQQVAARDRLPDTGPRKDYMVRIEGPLVRDAADVFHRRWRFLLDTRARYFEDASDFVVPPVAPPIAGGIQAQVTATLPAPFLENDIAETWFNAVNNAREYIFIEDQYFRVPMLTDVILRRMEAVPALRLVVITKPVGEWTDPGCAWTRRTHEQFVARFPTRYTALQLRAFDTQITFGIDETDAHFLDMDTHSKILIVDDVFLSVGSANKNNRGLIYEGELNVAVYDRAWVSAARRRIIANILPAGAAVSDDTPMWVRALGSAASYNDAVRARWTSESDDLNLNGSPLPEAYRPRGLIYTLTFGPVRDCLVEDIGPDVV